MFENITSFFENYKGKIRNPLIGTIISVWLVHNWVIVYSLFNFDKECTMQDKINYISDYFSKKSIWWEFLSIIGIALLILILTFISLGVSRFLTDLYYKIVENWVINLLDKKTIFTNVDRLALETKNEKLNKSIIIIREENAKVEGLNQTLLLQKETLVKEKENDFLKSSEEFLNLNKKIKTLENKNSLSTLIINYFDDIIHGLSDSTRKEIMIFIEHQDNIKTNSYENFVGLKSDLEKIGVLTRKDNKSEITEIGKLFLEYYQITINDFTIEKR